MDWTLVLLLVLLGGVGLGLWLFFRKPYGGSRHTTDFVANKGMAASFLGDKRRDTVERLSDPRYQKRHER